MSEPVRKLITPISLSYEVTAGQDLSEFLQALMDKRIIGKRCPATDKVYVPPRGASPTHGVRMTDVVEVADHGTITTFCVVNIPFEGQELDPPYVAASVLLDGADTPLFHLVGNAEVSDVRMGMRVRAVWRADEDLEPTLESIRFFEPTGEPDADYETYKDHL